MNHSLFPFPSVTLALASVAVLFSSTPAKADDFIWTPTTPAGGFYRLDTPANWSPNGTPGSGDTGIFQGDASLQDQPTARNVQAFLGLDFQTAGWLLNRDAGGALTIGADGINSAGAGTNTILDATITQSGTGTWTIGAGNTLYLNTALLIGSGDSLVKEGEGTLRYNAGQNPATWDSLVVNNGVFENNQTGAGSVGITNLTLSGGATVQKTGNRAFTLSNVFADSGGGILDSAGSGGTNNTISNLADSNATLELRTTTENWVVTDATMPTSGVQRIRINSPSQAGLFVHLSTQGSIRGRVIELTGQGNLRGANLSNWGDIRGFDDTLTSNVTTMGAEEGTVKSGRAVGNHTTIDLINVETVYYSTGAAFINSDAGGTFEIRKRGANFVQRFTSANSGFTGNVTIGDGANDGGYLVLTGAFTSSTGTVTVGGTTGTGTLVGNGVINKETAVNTFGTMIVGDLTTATDPTANIFLDTANQANNILTFGSNLTLNGTLLLAIDPDGVGAFGQISMLGTGDLALGGASSLALIFNAGDDPDGGKAFWNSNQTFTFLDATGTTGTIVGTFANLNFGDWTSGHFELGSYTDTLSLTWVPIPEPRVAGLLGIALGALAWARRRRILLAPKRRV